MNKLNITIARQPFDHLFYHFVLCYSNWQAGRICFSQSFESLSLGIQDALWKLGGVPFYHRTDNLTSAVHKVDHPDIFTDKYRGLAGHYGFESSKTNPASPHENGESIEILATIPRKKALLDLSCLILADIPKLVF